MSAVGRGFAAASDESLELAHGFLLKGLEKVGEAWEDDTFHTVGPKGAAPPSQSGHLTLGLLVRCAEEMAHRANSHHIGGNSLRSGTKRTQGAD